MMKSIVENPGFRSGRAFLIIAVLIYIVDVKCFAREVFVSNAALLDLDIGEK